MGLPELFHFLNFFVRPTVKETAVLALAAGIKVFGSQNFFWIYVYGCCGSFLFYEFFFVSIQKTEKQFGSSSGWNKKATSKPFVLGILI